MNTRDKNSFLGQLEDWALAIEIEFNQHDKHLDEYTSCFWAPTGDLGVNMLSVCMCLCAGYYAQEGSRGS